jgi:hypothetical protein
MLSAAPVALGISCQLTSAAVETWTGTNSAEWGTSGNWTGADPIPAAGDVLSFTSGVTLSASDNNLGNNYSLGGLKFNTGAGAYSLTSNRGANNQTPLLTGPLIDNAANGATTTQAINFGINSSSGLILGSHASQNNILALNASSNFSYFNVATNTTSATPGADALIIGADRVRHWMTLNEPQCFLTLGQRAESLEQHAVQRSHHPGALPGRCAAGLGKRFPRQYAK